MRLSSLLPFVGLAAVTVAAADAKAEANADDSEKPTTFDGIEVPPLINLTPKNFDEHLNATKYLYVKHYR
jgi:protein disulfide-isomerase